MYLPEHHLCLGQVPFPDDVETPWLICVPDAVSHSRVPVVLSLTASLGFLPTAAVGRPATRVRRAGARTARTSSYVVNTRTDHRTIESVKKAIAAAGGTVVDRVRARSA